MLVILIIAVSLSMDAFSLSLAYGTYSLLKKDIIILSVIVGLYHFVMPLLGAFVGNFILENLHINPDITIFIIFLIIGIQMICESLKTEDVEKKSTLIELLIFGFAVSIDSFSIGIGLKTLTSNYVVTCLIFCITSLTFTFIGLNIGKYINKIIGKLSTIVGGIILIVIGFIYYNVKK